MEAVSSPTTQRDTSLASSTSLCHCDNHNSLIKLVALRSPWTASATGSYPQPVKSNPPTHTAFLSDHSVTLLPLHVSFLISPCLLGIPCNSTHRSRTPSACFLAVCLFVFLGVSLRSRDSWAFLFNCRAEPPNSVLTSPIHQDAWGRGEVHAEFS
jgi:hypothetical protein